MRILIAVMLVLFSVSAAKAEDGHRWILVGRTFFGNEFQIIVIGTFATKEACEAGGKDLAWMGVKGTACLDRGVLDVTVPPSAAQHP
ncbi:hypothetical protein LJR164_004444 [Phenylobacterium sp. LjRoot164]|uniref:hypothetical protein n=1 Tax=unclassified Phenylobacterium TaxID=2640670 RepID=UPI003ECD8CB7